jgi:hypothetical protein
MRRVLCSIALFFAAASVLVPSAWADNLAPGGSGSPDVFPLLNPGVTLEAYTGVLPWVDPMNVDFNGTAATEVYSDPSNAFCSGCLDFIFEINSVSGGNINQISYASFTGFNTDVGVIGSTCGSNVTPSGVSRSGDGSTVNFNFSPVVVEPGQCTVGLDIQTNATSFTAGTVNVIGSAFDPTIASYAPTTATATPEPSSLMLLASGLVGLIGLRKRIFTQFPNG